MNPGAISRSFAFLNFGNRTGGSSDEGAAKPDRVELEKRAMDYSARIEINGSQLYLALQDSRRQFTKNEKAAVDDHG
jgi:hypothetical protein